VELAGLGLFWLCARCARLESSCAAELEISRGSVAELGNASVSLSKFLSWTGLVAIFWDRICFVRVERLNGFPEYRFA
jgi:hypothetical protein